MHLTHEHWSASLMLQVLGASGIYAVDPPLWMLGKGSSAFLSDTASDENYEHSKCANKGDEASSCAASLGREQGGSGSHTAARTLRQNGPRSANLTHTAAGLPLEQHPAPHPGHHTTPGSLLVSGPSQADERQWQLGQQHLPLGCGNGAMDSSDDSMVCGGSHCPGRGQEESCDVECGSAAGKAAASLCSPTAWQRPTRGQGWDHGLRVCTTATAHSAQPSSPQVSSPNRQALRSAYLSSPVGSPSSAKGLLPGDMTLPQAGWFVVLSLLNNITEQIC
jgi:hypothetical protein